jgi:hypothetical protein
VEFYPTHCILPELCIEIWLFNKSLDILEEWVEGHVKGATLEEKLCRFKGGGMEISVEKNYGCNLQFTRVSLHRST